MRAALGGAAALLPAVTEIMGPPDQPAADRRMTNVGMGVQQAIDEALRLRRWSFARPDSRRPISIPRAPHGYSHSVVRRGAAIAAKPLICRGRARPLTFGLRKNLGAEGPASLTSH